MRFRLLIAAASAAALLTPGTAGAMSLAEANPPTRAELAAVKAKVTWPLTGHAAKAAPGKRYTVRVRRGSARVTVSLVRVDSKLRPARMIARRALRRGTFTVRIPKTPTATYALRLRAGGKTFFAWIVVGAEAPATVVPSAPAPSPPPAPKPAPAPPSPCASEDPAQAAATLTFADGPPAQPVAPGTSVNAIITNTGRTCLAGADAELERETAPGTWETVEQRDANGRPIMRPALFIVDAPGAVRRTVASIPPDAVPGVYRLRIPVASKNGPGWLPLGYVHTEPFTVAAP